MKKDYALFRRTTPVWLRLVFATVFAVVLMLVDGQAARLGFVRSAVQLVVSPIQKSLQTSKQWASDLFVHSYNIEKINLDNQALRSDMRAQAARIAQLAQVEADNAELRGQLNLKQATTTPSIAAEVLYQVVDPYARKLVLNRGSSEGVELGQPVITGDGLIGQITAVTANTSELTLVIDPKIYVPVLVERAAANMNAPVLVAAAPEVAEPTAGDEPIGSTDAVLPTAAVNHEVVRGLLSGDEREGYLSVSFFSQRASIQVGDMLVTSGNDGLYPQGLKVGRVTAVDKADGDARSRITIVPTTKGMAARYVLILKVDDVAARKKHADAQSADTKNELAPSTLGGKIRAEREQARGDK